MKTFKIRKMMSSSALRWYALVTALVAIAAYALTPVDTVITNRAVVEYEDAVGNSFSSESNPAEIIVGAVYSATIEQDRLDFTGAAGQQVYVPYVLSNNGNSTVDFNLAVDLADLLTTNATGASVAGLSVFEDADGNGEPDTGATDLNGSFVTLAGETSLSLVVAVSVPTGATAGQTVGFVLGVGDADFGTSGLVVDDLTASDGVDGGGTQDNGATDALDPVLNGATTSGNETVHGLVTVTTDAVLVLTKDSSFDTVAQEIDYTLTIKNNGGDTATEVDIYDFVPYADVNGDGNYDSGTDFYLPYSANIGESGLLVGNGDTVAAVYDGGNDFADITGVLGDKTFVEGTQGEDLNGDGDTSDSVTGALNEELIFAQDAAIAPNVEVSITFSVSYGDVLSSVPAGTLIRNQFCTVADLDDDDATLSTTAQCSNEVIDIMPSTYAVEAGDTTAADGDDFATDGDDQGSTTFAANDEDADDNDDQFVSSGSEGQQVIFYHVIENTGNDEDAFTVSVDTSTGGVANFPAGTTFEVFDSTGGALAGNTTPIIQNGDSYVVQIVATLPTIAGTGSASNSAGTLLGGGSFHEDDNGLFCVDADVGAADDCSDGTPFSTDVTYTSVNDTSQSDTAAISILLLAVSAPDLINVDTNNTAGTGVADRDLDPVTDSATLVADVLTAGNQQIDGGATDGTEEPYFIADSAFIPGDSITFELAVGNETGLSDTFELGFEFLGEDASGSFDEDGAGTVSLSGAAGSLPEGWSLEFQDINGIPVTTTTLLPSDGTANSVFFYTAVVTTSSDGAESPAGSYDFRFTVDGIVSGRSDSKVDRLTIAEDCQIVLTEPQTDVIQAGGTVDFDHILRNNGNTTQTIAPTIGAGALPSGWSAVLQVEIWDATGPASLGYVDYSTAPTNMAVFNNDGTVATREAGATVDLAPEEYMNFRIRVFAPATAAAGESYDITIDVAGTPVAPATQGCNATTNTDTVQVIDEQVRIFKAVSLDTDCDCVSDDGTFDVAGEAPILPNQCAIWQLTAENQGDTDALNVVIRDAVTDFSTLENGGTATVDGTNLSWSVGTLEAGESSVQTFCVRIQ